MGYFDENLENLKKVSEGVESDLEVSTKMLEEIQLDLEEVNKTGGDEPNIGNMWIANRLAITRLITAVIDLERRFLHDSPSVES